MVTITDLGNDLQFTFANGHIYTLNKLQLKIKQDDNFVYLTNGSGFVNTAENKVVKLAASEITSPVYADNDALVLGMVALAGSVSLGGGGASAGGGASVWSTKQKDFVATTTDDTKNITITGLAWTLEAENVAIVELFSASGDKSTLDLTNVTVSGGVITLGDIDDFVAGDTVSVTLIGEDKAYDADMDNQLVVVQNSDASHYTDIEHIIDEANVDAATYRTEFYMDSFKNLAIHLNGSGGVTFTLWATNNDAADTTADTNWVDVTTALLGAASFVDSEVLKFVEDVMPLKFMIKYVASDATNAVDAWIRKY